MASVNLCIFIGNLTRDPEVKYTPKGTAVASFGLALNEVWTDDAGTKHENVSFVDIECWGRTAEIAGEYLKKGSQTHLQCHVKQDTWDDKQTGQKRSKLKFVIDKLTLIGGKRDSTPKDDREESRAAAAAPRSKPKPPPDPDLDAGEDDIPF